MFEAIGALLVLGFGSHDVLTGSLQLGDLVGILMLMAFLYDPISRLHQLNQLVQAGRAAGERVFEILDEDAEPGVVAGVGDPARDHSRGYTAHHRRHSLRKCELQLRRWVICASTHFISRAAGHHDSAGRRDWRGKIDAGEFACALLRVRLRPDLRR